MSREAQSTDAENSKTRSGATNVGKATQTMSKSAQDIARDTSEQSKVGGAGGVVTTAPVSAGK